MPKKKKKSARGKVKKAVGNGKKKEKEQGSLDAQMEELKIGDENSMLEEAIKLAAAEREALKSGDDEKEPPQIRRQCDHGYVAGEDHAIIDDVAQACFQTCLKVFQTNGNWFKQVTATLNALSKKYPGMCDPYKMKLVISSYLFQGTDNFLDGDLQSARYFAFLACHFDNFVTAVFERQNLLLDPANAVKQYDF